MCIKRQIQKNLSKVKSANPLTYITKKTPPFLVIHGMLDKLVPYCQSEVLHNALKSKNRESKLVLIEDGKHGPEVFTEKYISLDYLACPCTEARNFVHPISPLVT